MSAKRQGKGAGHSSKGYLTSPFQIVLALLMFLALSGMLSACEGLQPYIFTTPTPVSQAASATRTPLSFNLSPTPLPSTPTLQPQSTIAVDLSRLKGITIRFWYANTSETGDPLAALADTFNATNEWGITVLAGAFTNDVDLFSKLESPGASEVPGLILGSSYQLDSASSSLVDLEPYLKDPVLGIPLEEHNDFYPAFWAEAEFGGQRLGLPLWRSLEVLFYNQSLANELGFASAPTSPDEFRSQACAASGKGYAVSLNYETAAAWMLANGQELGGVIDQTYPLNNANTRQAYTFLRDLYDQGCAFVPQNRYPTQEFAGRDALFIAGSTAWLSQQRAAFERLGSTDSWTVLAFPGSSSHPWLYSAGQSLAIVKSDSEQQLAAWLFARSLVSLESQAELVRQSGVMPVRASALGMLSDYTAQNPQWKAAAELLSKAAPEPQKASWELVRWSLQDSLVRLLSPTFTSELITDLVKMLGDTANELDQQYP